MTLAVTNRLSEPTSIHWHGVRTPSPMDGVPGLSFAGIPPGETFVYRFPVHQSGTYWYHSHSGFQEQTGVYGPIVIEPEGGYAQAFDRDYVVMLSDWTDEDPEAIVSNLKFQSNYYNYGQRTLGTFLADAQTRAFPTAQLFAGVVAFETIDDSIVSSSKSAGTVRASGASGARSQPRQYRTEILRTSSLIPGAVAEGVEQRCGNTVRRQGPNRAGFEVSKLTPSRAKNSA